MALRSESREGLDELAELSEATTATAVPEGGSEEGTPGARVAARPSRPMRSPSAAWAAFIVAGQYLFVDEVWAGAPEPHRVKAGGAE